PSWRTLYELTRIDAEVLEAKIIDGTINPKMERKEVAVLKALSGAKKESRTLPPPIDEQSDAAPLPADYKQKIDATLKANPKRSDRSIAKQFFINASR